MPLQKLQFRPGLNREGTDYSNEGGWYDGDKIRFRSGFPEKIGGWTQLSPNTFNGVCRSIWIWLDGDAGVGQTYIGLGTNTNYYIYSGGTYNDITPFVDTNTLTDPFQTYNTLTTVTVTDAGYSPSIGDYVIFSGATAVGGLTIDGTYQVISTPTSTTYTITASAPATSNATGGGTVTAQYEYPVGRNVYSIGTGWGSGPWGGALSPVTSLLGANPFASISGSSTVTVTQTAHGYTTTAGAFVVGRQYRITSIGSTDFTLIGASANTVGLLFTATGVGSGTGTASVPTVVFTGATTFGGIPAAMINNSFAITVTTANAYTITLPDSPAGSFVTSQKYVITSVGTTNFIAIGAAANTVGTAFTATGPGTGTGTASFAATSNANGGGSSATVLAGSGSYGWGTSYSSGIGQQLRLWSNDNYGFDLVIAPRGGPIFYWSDVSTVSTHAVNLQTLANETAAFTDASTFGPVITAGAFVVGQKYVITFVGTTNFTLIGAASNTVGVSFTATGVGAGTGTAALLQTYITVTSANAPSVYPFMYITGTGIPAGTYVSSSYVSGSTTVPLTFTAPATSTTSSSSGNYTFSYAGSSIPNETYQVIASAIQEFVIAYGSCPYVPGVASGTGLSEFNPMIVRWSDQGNAYQWIPQVTNQSGEFLLTNGSYIMGARATRQEILVWTDSCIYSQQYLGAPYVWGFQVLMDNISVMSPNCMITINNVTYWMGKDRFYMYSGRVEVLPCALRQYIFDDINQDQAYQVFAGANEAYNEVWWYYVSGESLDFSVDRYIIYNYLDRVWYYGTLGRTAWMQTGTQQYPIAASYYTNAIFTGTISGDTLTVTAKTVGTIGVGQTIISPNVAVGTTITALGSGSGATGTYTVNLPQSVTSTTMSSSNGNGILLYHEDGNDDLSTSATLPITSYVQSSDFDIGDGHNFGFVWRILPDVNFNGSSINQPSVTMTVKPRQNSGTPYGQSDNPQVQSAQNYTNVPAYTIQEFDGQVYTRLRGRQMSFRIESTGVGVAWQLGSPRIDIRPDGRR